jgi:hypothetical protein
MRLGCVLVLCCVLAACGSEPRAVELGPKLYFAGDNELWIADADSGRVWHRFSSQLAGGDPPHKVLARGNRVVMGTPYGDRAFFLPSARRDRVWVVDLRSSSGTAFAVREVTVDGETTVAARRTPNPRWPIGAVRDGLLLEGNGQVMVWDPRSGKVVHHLAVPAGLLGPAAGDVVTACVDVYCPVLRLIDIHSGRVRVARAPVHQAFEPWAGAFSPNGRLLALALRGPGRPATAPRRLALIDVPTGRVAVVRGSDVAAGYNLVAWSADGRHVFITGGERGARRTVVGYRLGTVRARTLDVTVGDFYDFAAT